MELSLWRAHCERITEFFDSECSDSRIAQLGELIYFLGESECDGVLGYMERRDASIVESLSQSADLIESEELMAVLSVLRDEIRQLPGASSFDDRVSAAIEATEEDPFDGSTLALYKFLPAIDKQLDQALRRLGVTQRLGIN